MRRFPAEWEKQQGILLCFPKNGNDWPGKYQAIQWDFIEFIKKIAIYEDVFLIVADKKLLESVKYKLELAAVDLEKIHFIIQKTNRSWMRDSGPIIVKNENNREALQFKFTGWAKYTNYQLDKNVPEKVANFLDIPIVKVNYKGKPVVLEGGALEVNGKGTLITTEECLLHTNIQVRNTGFTKQDYEAIFKEYLGIEQTIWLKDGIIGDDTHGHIDDLCRFVNEDTVVTVIENDKKSPNYKALQENLEILQQTILPNGKPLKVIQLPMPEEIIFEGINLPASYANFLIINKAVLVPTFNDSNDRIALNILSDCFPNRTIIGINATDLIWGFGTLHCLSQQIAL